MKSQPSSLFHQSGSRRILSYRRSSGNVRRIRPRFHRRPGARPGRSCRDCRSSESNDRPRCLCLFVHEESGAVIVVAVDLFQKDVFAAGNVDARVGIVNHRNVAGLDSLMCRYCAWINMPWV